MKATTFFLTINVRINLKMICQSLLLTAKSTNSWNTLIRAVPREYIAVVPWMGRVKAKAGSLYYYDLANHTCRPKTVNAFVIQQQGNGNPQEGVGNQQNHQHSSGMCSSEYWKEAEVGKNGNYVPVEVTISCRYWPSRSRGERSWNLTISY